MNEAHARPVPHAHTATIDALALRQRAWRDARLALRADARQARRLALRSLLSLRHDARHGLKRRTA